MHAKVIPVLPVDTLFVRPWPDPVIDRLGHDPRSHYVETYWLGILGPSTTWLLRRVVAGFDDDGCGDGYELDLAETARCLGLGERRSRHSPFARALSRLVQFDVAQLQGDRVLAVRRRLPPLNRRQVERLPRSLRRSHQELREADLHVDAGGQARRRAEQLALSLLDLGEDAVAIERQLLRWKFPPTLAREATAWAAERRASRRDGVA
ncbi:MAG TPA: hypothetical protein VHF47_10515 [Acidimicrobiales bacterium]|nr:hypothetical protein [Acidimicrobiales bacterium]